MANSNNQEPIVEQVEDVAQEEVFDQLVEDLNAIALNLGNLSLRFSATMTSTETFLREYRQEMENRPPIPENELKDMPRYD
tara:strand:- start:493 stop:735 length:243 start_codon:yes stop_codon:yes gene_type:complete